MVGLRTRYSIPLVLLIATAIMLLPFWLRGGSQGHDLFHHLLSSHFFAMQLWQGELYPRWLMAMNGSFGSPVFFFYPPLPYYVNALFAGPTPLAHEAMEPLLWSNSLALWLSGLFAYLWLRTFASPRRALGASLLYMALPYHLAIDIYARFALAESWAFVWAPLALLGQDRLSKQAPFGLLLLAFAVAMLALSNLPSLLLILALLTVRSLVLAWRNQTSDAIWPTLLAQGWGLAMASLLLLPALLDQGGISMEQMRTGIFEFQRNFLDRLPQSLDDWRFRGHLTWLTILTLVLLLVAWAATREPHHPELRRWGVIGTLCFLMTLSVSEPLWQLLTPLQLVQFPWRFNLILVIATVAVVALAPPVHRLWQWLWWGLLALIMASQALYVRESPLTQSPDKAAIDTLFDSKRSAREYRPRQVPRGNFSPTLLAWKDEFQPEITTQRPGIQWQIQSWRPRNIVLTVNAKTPATLVMHQYYYPGWQAWRDDGTELPVSNTQNGLLQVQIPAGDYRLTVTLSARWPERLGYGLSLVTWLAWWLALAGTFIKTRYESPNTARHHDKQPGTPAQERHARRG